MSEQDRRQLSEEEVDRKLDAEDQLLAAIFGRKAATPPEERAARRSQLLSEGYPRMNSVDQASSASKSDPQVDSALRFILKEQVEKTFGGLDEVQRFVLEWRFGLIDGRDRTLEEVGKGIGRSRWTARRIEKKALEEIRGVNPSKSLRDYLI
jgi:DNA-directed RNA polymerase specialized sigma subunit